MQKQFKLYKFVLSGGSTALLKLFPAFYMTEQKRNMLMSGGIRFSNKVETRQFYFTWAEKCTLYMTKYSNNPETSPDNCLKIEVVIQITGERKKYSQQMF